MEELAMQEPPSASHNNCSCCVTLDRRRVSLSLRTAIFLGVSCVAGIAVLTTLFTYLLTLNCDVSNPSVVDTTTGVNISMQESPPPTLDLLKRLSDDVLPDLYDLKFMPMLDEEANNFTFYGEVSEMNLIALISIYFEKYTICLFRSVSL